MIRLGYREWVWLGRSKAFAAMMQAKADYVEIHEEWLRICDLDEADGSAFCNPNELVWDDEVLEDDNNTVIVKKESVL